MPRGKLSECYAKGQADATSKVHTLHRETPDILGRGVLPGRNEEEIRDMLFQRPKLGMRVGTWICKEDTGILLEVRTLVSQELMSANISKRGLMLEIRGIQ